MARAPYCGCGQNEDGDGFQPSETTVHGIDLIAAMEWYFTVFYPHGRYHLSEYDNGMGSRTVNFSFTNTCAEHKFERQLLVSAPRLNDALIDLVLKLDEEFVFCRFLHCVSERRKQHWRLWMDMAAWYYSPI